MKEKYWKLKNELLELLGNVCAIEGCFETENLEFHHVFGNPKLTKNNKRGGYLNLVDVRQLLSQNSKSIELRCNNHHNRGGI